MRTYARTEVCTQLISKYIEKLQNIYLNSKHTNEFPENGKRQMWKLSGKQMKQIANAIAQPGETNMQLISSVHL